MARPLLVTADRSLRSAAPNARGALEVVVATIGRSIGVLGQAADTAIVVMAVVTSASAGPLLAHRTPSRRQ